MRRDTHRKLRSQLFVMLVALSCAASARGALIDESISGDISSEIANPTPFTLDLGSNLITAHSGGLGSSGATDGSDAEFLRVIVPDGLTLQAISVVSREGASARSFIAYNVGDALSGQGTGDIMDGALFEATTQDLLDGSSSSNTDESLGVDFLGPGSYAFWIQETAGSVHYTLNFLTTPEPTPGALFALGLGLLALLRRAL